MEWKPQLNRTYLSFFPFPCPFAHLTQSNGELSSPTHNQNYNHSAAHSPFTTAPLTGETVKLQLTAKPGRAFRGNG